MGQKIRPSALRLGIIRGWESTWYADGPQYRQCLLEDLKLRDFIRKYPPVRNAGVARIQFERRVGDAVRITIATAKPGIVIGRGGSGVDELKRRLEKLIGRKVHVNVQEIQVPELCSELVAENVASAIERRVAFRRAMKQAIQRTMRYGAKGVKVTVAGRLGGAEIARTETAREGSLPLQTIRADIDYAVTAARTKYGYIGVKVWIYKGDIIPIPSAEEAAERRLRPSGRVRRAEGEPSLVQAQETQPVAEAIEAGASQIPEPSGGGMTDADA